MSVLYWSSGRQKMVWSVCLVLWLSFLALQGCKKPGEAQAVAVPQEEARPCVRVIPVQSESVRQELVLRANLTANRQAMVVPRSGGWVRELRVDQGDPVVGGETVMAVIGTLDLDLNVSSARAGVEMAQAGLRQAELQLQSARSELERVQSLYDRGVATSQQLEQVQVVAEAADEGVTQARANLRMTRDQTRRAQDLANDTEVIAPFDGVVYQRLVEVGQLIPAFASIPLFQVIDPGQIRVVASVPETMATALSQGMPAVVELRDGRTIPTTISYVAPALDMASRSRTVWSLLDNAEGQLIHGGTATLRIELGLTEGPVIPRQAIARVEGERGFVYALNPDGESVREVVVRLGALQNDAYPALEGIEPGVEVVEYGWTYLEEGSLVQATRGQTCDAEGE